MILFNTGGNIYPEPKDLVRAAYDYFQALLPYLVRMDPVEGRAFEAWVVADLASQFNGYRLRWPEQDRQEE